MEKPLTELQGEVKKDPELYKETVIELIKEYSLLFSLFPESPSSPNVRLGELISFLSQISPYFLSELKNFPSQLLNILNNYYSALDSEFRMLLFQGLMLLRNREQIPAMSILPICFKLFRCQDKTLRLQAFNFIIKDIKKVNKHTQNYKINKQLQGFIYEMIEDTNITAAKKSLHVLMTLYKKRIWIDNRTVNVIANACLLKESKLVMIGCTFLLVADNDQFDSDSEGDDEAPSTKIIGAKKTKAKLNQKERAVKHFHKRNRRKERKFDKGEPSFLTIDQLNNPQGFVETLLHNLQKFFNKGKHELQSIMLQVTARIVGRHKLMLTDLYPFIQKFITPKSKKVTQMLIICAEATHELVPPQELNPVIKKVLDNFLSEHCSEEYIVLGLNCLREICKRQPLVMTKELLEHINTFKNFKNKSVVMATAGLVNLFKEIRPSLLRNKLREGEVDMVGEYGEVKVYTRVPGAELLEEKAATTPWGNQQVLISRPQQKSENLQKLEIFLKRRNENQDDKCRKKRKINEDKEEIIESNEDVDSHQSEVLEIEDNEGSGIDSELESSEEELETDSEELEIGSQELDTDNEELNSENEALDSDDRELNSDDQDLDSDDQDLDVRGQVQTSENNEEVPELVPISTTHLKSYQIKTKRKDSSESLEGADDTSIFYNPGLTIPFECDRILTQKDFNRIKQLKKEAEARRRRLDISLLPDSDDSNEFLEDEDLETMQISKEEKIRLSVEEKVNQKRKKREKKGGKTNKEHAKCKPVMMVMKKKKNSMKQQFEAVKKKIRRSKQQLGKFSKRFNSTKRQLK